MAAPQQPTQKNPQIESLRAQAREAMEAKKLREAYDLYQQIIELSPRDNEANEKVGLIAMQRLQTLTKEAEALLKAKKYPKAEEALNEILELDPNNKLAAQKLRMLSKVHGEAKVMKFVKLGLIVVGLVALFAGSMFAWNQILISDGKKAISEERFDVAKEKFDAVGKFGVGKNELDRHKRFTANLIRIVDLIPKHEYFDARRLLNDCEKIEFQQHPIYLKWNEEWGKQKDKWVGDRLGEGEQAVKDNQFDKGRDIVAKILKQDPPNTQAVSLGKKNDIAEGIFLGYNALNDRDLKTARRKAVEALSVVDAKSPEGVRATELKAKAKMALIREKKSFPAHKDYAVLSVATSPDGKYICSTGGDGKLSAFDATKLTEIKTIPVTGGDVFGLAISGDSAYAAITYFKKVDVYSAGSWTLFQSLAGHDLDNRAVRCVAFSARNNFMASGSEGHIRVWRVPAFGEPFQKLTSHTKMVNALAFSGDEKFLASVSDDDTLKIYAVDPSGVREEKSIDLPGMEPVAVAFSGDSKFLVVGTVNGSLLVYSVGPTWDKFKTLSLKEKVQSLAFSPNSEYLAAGGSQGSLFVFETQKFNEAWSKAKAHPEQINAVAFCKDSESIVSGSKGQIKIWEPEP